jgi:hypothetical protein
MKAILVNPDTFDKIGKTVRSNDLDSIKQYYYTGPRDDALYLVVHSMGNSRVIPLATLDNYWEGDKSKTDWFEIRPKGVRE